MSSYDSLKTKFNPQDIIVAMGLIATVALTYFVALPQSKIYKQKVADLKAKEAQLQAMNQRAADLVSVADRLPKHQASLERLKLAYPKTDQTIEALVQARTIAEQSGMTVKGLSPGKGKPTGLPVTFVLSGSYESLAKFSRELHQNLRPITVQSLSLTAGGEKAGGSINVTANTSFIYNTTATGTAAAPALPPPNPTGS